MKTGNESIYVQEADPICAICGANGGHETDEVRSVPRTGRGRGLRGGAGKRVDGVCSTLWPWARFFTTAYLRSQSIDQSNNNI